jgi:hypothetical protein
VTSGGLLRQTVAGCAILAFVAAVAGSVAGHPTVGLGLAAGLMLGSMNGYLLQGLLARGAPFVAASLLRIVLFSAIVLLAAIAVRGEAWAFALGIGLAQLVLVVAGLRAGLRS